MTTPGRAAQAEPVRLSFTDEHGDGLAIIETPALAIRMDVGGHVIVKPLKAWHALAPLADHDADASKMIAKPLPRKLQHQVYAWLGYWRDKMPIEAVTGLRSLLGPLDVQPTAEPLSDAEIAKAMITVDDPLLWGRLGDGQGDMVRQFARAVIAAHEAKKEHPDDR